MFCSNCGAELDDRAVICPRCGVATENLNKMQTPSRTTPPKSNPLSIAGFTLSLVSVLFAFVNVYLFMVVSITAIVLSIAGLVKSRNLNSGKGLGLAGVIISAVVIIFYILLVILALIFAFSLFFLFFIPFI